MPRSPLTETYEKVNDIFQTINALEPDQRNLLLDWLFPEPEPAKKPQKKSSKKTAGGGGRSKRASGMAKALNDNLSQRRQEALDDITGESAPHAPGDLCTSCVYVFGHNVHHLPSVQGYHEFHPAATSAAGAGD